MLEQKSNEVFGLGYSDLDLNQRNFILSVVKGGSEKMENIQVFEAQKEDLNVDINKIRNFLNDGVLDKLPIETAQEMKRKLAIDLSEFETERNQIENDLNQYIDVSVYKAESDRNLREDLEIEKGADEKGLYAICPKCDEKCRYSAYGDDGNGEPCGWACECVDCDELLAEH